MKIDKELELDDLFHLYKKNIKIILLTVCIFAGLGFLKYLKPTTPLYKSSATVLVEKVANFQDVNINMNKNLNVDIFKYLLTSDNLINNALNKANIKLDVSDIKSNLELSTEKENGIIKIELSNENAEIIPEIINKLVEELEIEVKEKYKVDNIYIIEEPSVSNTPYNETSKIEIIKFVIIGLVLICSIIFIRYYLDDKVTSVRQIEKILGKDRLTLIPEINKKG